MSDIFEHQDTTAPHKTPLPDIRIDYGYWERRIMDATQRPHCPVCPTWVVRCSHLDDDTVYVVDVSLARGITGAGYEVHGPTQITLESENPDVRTHGFTWKGCTPEMTTSREEADEFFVKRDKELRTSKTTML